MMKKRTRWLLEGYHLAKVSATQANVETAWRGLRPTMGHYGCSRMMNTHSVIIHECEVYNNKILKMSQPLQSSPARGPWLRARVPWGTLALPRPALSLHPHLKQQTTVNVSSVTMSSSETNRLLSTLTPPALFLCNQLKPTDYWRKGFIHHNLMKEFPTEMTLCRLFDFLWGLV